MTKELKLSPSYLFIGPEGYIENIAKNFIKTVFCNDINKIDNGCSICIECKKVDQKLHHHIIWLEPIGQYTTSDLEPIFKSVTFALEETKHFFFVISKAQQLNQFCANSLLKLMEEPPRGYHFILTAQTKERILPTILSRCIVQQYNATSEADSAFFNFFNKIDEPNFLGFNQALQATKIIESDLMILIDQVFSFWSCELQKSLIENNRENIALVQKILDLMNEARSNTIMPGSGKIFLRNLYMRYIMLTR